MAGNENVAACGIRRGTYNDSEEGHDRVCHGDTHAFGPQVADENCPQCDSYDGTQSTWDDLVRGEVRGECNTRIVEWQTHAIFDTEHIRKPRILCLEAGLVRRSCGGATEMDVRYTLRNFCLEIIF